MRLRARPDSRIPGGRRVWLLGGVSAGTFGTLLLIAHIIGRFSDRPFLGIDMGARHVLWNALAWIGCGAVAILSWLAAPQEMPRSRDRS